MNADTVQECAGYIQSSGLAIDQVGDMLLRLGSYQLRDLALLPRNKRQRGGAPGADIYSSVAVHLWPSADMLWHASDSVRIRIVLGAPSCQPPIQHEQN